MARRRVPAAPPEKPQGLRGACLGLSGMADGLLAVSDGNLALFAPGNNVASADTVCRIDAAVDYADSVCAIGKDL